VLYFRALSFLPFSVARAISVQAPVTGGVVNAPCQEKQKAPALQALEKI
jgi:hypothetical protein